MLSYENRALILKDSKYIHKQYITGRNNIATNKPGIDSGIRNEIWDTNDGHKSNCRVRLLPRCKGNKLYRVKEKKTL